MARSESHRILGKIFPFLSWLRDYNIVNLRADLIAGLTVALVLIPQSMAYAQLAGLPVYYGLYAAFLPPIIAGLFGSSRQLATGPVAVVSLMTAAALEPLARVGSEGFIAYAVSLALLVGVFQFALGVFRLGIIVNFLSHPVVNGFTNAAALIIASSQLPKLFGVHVDKAEHHYETVYRAIRSAMEYTHWPTLGLAILAFLIMLFLKRLNPRVPNVLVAVVVTTLISWAMGFERDCRVDISRIESPQVTNIIEIFNTTNDKIAQASTDRAALMPMIRQVEKERGAHTLEAIGLRHRLALLNVEIEERKEEMAHLREKLRSFLFEAAPDTKGGRSFFSFSRIPHGEQSDGRMWRIRVGNHSLDKAAICFRSGGSVVGNVPKGLPKLTLPKVNLSLFSELIPVAMVISLLGFMEAISIAKAMAAKTGQRLDPNQELIGQGLANIIGSIGQSYPVSGSFSRSAVNIQAGAVTAMSSVFTSGVVIVTLLFFTPLLYYLPESVLAAIIMMAVVGLLNVRGVIRAWKAQKYDGLIAVITFISTLVFAPHLDKGIMIGVVLSLGISLFRHMRPEIAILSKHRDGSYRNSARWGLKQCRYIAVIRFYGSLFFATINYLEDQVLERVAAMPDLKHVLIVGNAINELDASGEEMLSSLIEKMQQAGYEISFSGLNDSILDVMKRTHLYERIGEDHMFRNVQSALQAIHAEAHRNAQEKVCPLLTPCYAEEKEAILP